MLRSCSCAVRSLVKLTATLSMLAGCQNSWLTQPVSGQQSVHQYSSEQINEELLTQLAQNRADLAETYHEEKRPTMHKTLQEIEAHEEAADHKRTDEAWEQQTKHMNTQ